MVLGHLQRGGTPTTFDRLLSLRFGAAATLLENAAPPHMVEIIEKYKATVCFTAPTAYRVMLRAMDEGAIDAGVAACLYTGSGKAARASVA